jgi:hypothetical protein
LPIRYTIDRITPFESLDRTPKWSPEVKSIKDKLRGRDDVVVFNVAHNVEAMFYSDLTIYAFVPDQATIDRVTRDGYHVVINDDGDPGRRFPVTDQAEVLRLVAADDE